MENNLEDPKYQEAVAKRQEELEQEKTAALRETLQRGADFDELIRTRGWERIKANFVNSVQAFTNKAINEGFKSIEEFNIERGKILGKREILNDIDASLKAAADERNKQSATTTS